MNKLAVLTCLLLNSCVALATNNQPRLIVQIVVDQLRGDLIHQHEHQFGKNGFNYLLNHGIDFQNAHHPHANTTTCAGHATIATGSYPSFHGIVDNDWYDRKTKKMVYCMEDLNAKVLPTQHTQKSLVGRSPRNLKLSTLSDEIVLSSKGSAFAVSLKDRSAIALAGHSGKAFWFDKSNGGFVTSDYYYSAYPQWVQEWNKAYHPKNYNWILSRPKEAYLNSKNKRFRHDYQNFGQSFPHHVLNSPTEAYFTSLSRTPKADKLTEDFAEHLLAQEKLGSRSDHTDYLGISFSAVDGIGHQFGPNSIEAEDNLLELDLTIAKLLAAIDKQVGLDNTLIVLSADHGVSDSPSYLKTYHIAEIKPVSAKKTEEFIHTLLAQKFHLPAAALLSVSPPYIYFDQQLIHDHQLHLSDVSRYVAESLSQQPGIFRAFSLPIAYIEKDWLSTKVDRMSYPARAGDIYIVQPPYQSYGILSENRVAHGSPWRYDSYVPLLFSHPNFKSQRISRPVSTTDIAPTLSTLMMIKAPSGAVGEPLEEVFKAFNSQGKEKS